MAEANLHKDLELSSSRSDSSSEKDSRLEPSSDGEIFDDENKDENKEENVKTEEEENDQAVKNKEENVKTKKREKDQAVKNFCEIKLKKVTNKLRVQLEKLIKMRAAAEEARERAEKADEGVAQYMKQIHKLQHKVIGYSMNPMNL